MLKRIFLILTIITTLSFSKVVTFEEIDPKKTVIQIGTYSQQKTVNWVQKTLKNKHDIFIRKTKKYSVVYVVNIPQNNKYKILKQLKKKHKDAFIQLKAYKVIQKLYPNKKPKKVVTLKPKKISKTQTVKTKKTDDKKIAIQIGTYSQQKTVNKIKKELEGKREIYVKKGKKYTIIYVVNIPQNKKLQTLKQLKKKFKDAFVSKINYKPTKKSVQLKIPEKQAFFIELNKEAMRYFKQGDYQQAYRLFKKAIWIDMTNLLVNYHFARSAYEIENYQEALSIYKYILDKNPNSHEVKLELAQTYQKLKQYKKAEKYFIEAYK